MALGKATLLVWTSNCIHRPPPAGPNPAHADPADPEPVLWSRPRPSSWVSSSVRRRPVSRPGLQQETLKRSLQAPGGPRPWRPLRARSSAGISSGCLLLLGPPGSPSPLLLPFPNGTVKKDSEVCQTFAVFIWAKTNLNWVTSGLEHAKEEPQRTVQNERLFKAEGSRKEGKNKTKKPT